LFSIYSLSTFGVGNKQFYCCGKLKTTILRFVPMYTDDYEMEGEMEDCSRTEVINLRVDDDHMATAAIDLPQKPFSEIHTPFQANSFSIDLIAAGSTSVSNIETPPLWESKDLNILHCIYRI